MRPVLRTPASRYEIVSFEFAGDHVSFDRMREAWGSPGCRAAARAWQRFAMPAAGLLYPASLGSERGKPPEAFSTVPTPRKRSKSDVRHINQAIRRARLGRAQRLRVAARERETPDQQGAIVVGGRR